MDTLYKRALRLEILLLGYNAVEAVVSLVAGALADSIALTGFGLDSVVESLSALVLIWRLRMHGRISEEEEERLERRAYRFVGATFLILGVYVAYESAAKIIRNEIPYPSIVGMVVAVLSMVVMPILGLAKYRLGKRMGLKSLVADAKETFFCAFLSAALLLGLLLNVMFGFWLADPIAALVIVVFLLREGWEMVFE
ncbi:MAG TPA: cation transporter [bacterium]